VHQGVEGWLNPNLNYPFREITVQTLSNFSSWAHQYGLKVKFYYTIRELSMYTEEVWALRTLNGEIFNLGNGTGLFGSKGTAWILEHIVDDYEPCWDSPLSNGEFDSVLCNSGIGRWTNYYVEGLLRSIVEPVEMDGIYFDGLVFTRDTMMRIRRVLDENRPNDKKLIDLHSGNEDDTDMTPWRASTVAAYTHLLPYVDSLWFGEVFYYSLSYDYWLVSISGLPFGLYGEMLGYGNPYYGMIYGMSQRHLNGISNPKPIWDFWDYFGIDESEMIGWWEPNCPVIPDVKNVMATVYKREYKSLIAIANWNTFDVNTTLSIDWSFLGLRESISVLSAPGITDFQVSSLFFPTDNIPIPSQKGWLLIINEID